MSEFDIISKSMVFYTFLFSLSVYLTVSCLPRVITLYVNNAKAKYFAVLSSHREKLLRKIVGKNKERVQILELRLNQSENLAFYPPGSDIFVLTATEEQAKTALQEKSCNYARVEPDLRSLKDFDNEEMDVVVGISALCRCSDQKKLLKEIYRVLAPGGKYFFIEHVNELHSNTTTYIVKEILSTLGKHCLVDMCRLNSDPQSVILGSGFQEVLFNKIQISSSFRLLHLLKSHIIGIATK